MFTRVTDATMVGFNGSAHTYEAFVNCPQGKTPVGGGYRFVQFEENAPPAEDADVNVILNEPFTGRQKPPRSGWRILVRNNSTPQLVAVVTAVCG